jgi:hypothetical protein
MAEDKKRGLGRIIRQFMLVAYNESIREFSRSARSMVILFNTLEIHLLFFINEFREGVYTAQGGTKQSPLHGGTEPSTPLRDVSGNREK